MKIYIAHSREFDYEKNLYQPIRAAKNLNQSEIILPHETASQGNNSREFYAELDLVIAEVSYPATGLGIELGWTFDSGVPIVCIYQKGRHYSGSLRAVSNRFYEYADSSELIKIIQDIVNSVLSE